MRRIRLSLQRIIKEFEIMQKRSAILASLAASLAIFAVVVGSAQQPAAIQGQGQTQGQGRGQGMRGMGGFPAGARGTLGTVTEVAPDHYTIKTDTGEILTIFYSVNTRIVKQGPGQGSGQGPGRRARAQGSDAGAGDGARAQPQPLKPTDIKVGDIITAGGEEDTAKKSIGAIFIAQIDPERAKQMREMQANYGKTWLAGRITGIEGTTITIDGIVDHAKHTIDVDENTSFHKRRDSITLADIQPGEQLRAEGAVKGSVFLATVVTTMEPRDRVRNGEQGGPEATPNSPAAGSAATSQPK
jgi:preprotein translocase subunit YajC